MYHDEQQLENISLREYVVLFFIRPFEKKSNIPADNFFGTVIVTVEYKISQKV